MCVFIHELLKVLKFAFQCFHYYGNSNIALHVHVPFHLQLEKGGTLSFRKLKALALNHLLGYKAALSSLSAVCDMPAHFALYCKIYICSIRLSTDGHTCSSTQLFWGSRQINIAKSLCMNRH